MVILTIVLALITAGASSAAEGVEEWNVTFGGDENEYGGSVQQTSDGGYIILSSANISGSYDMWLIKTNNLGSEEWNVTFGGDEREYGEYVQQTTDGGYILAGSKETFYGWDDGWLIKTNDTGSEEWNVTFGNSGYYDETLYSVQQTSDGGYIVAGESDNYDDYDMWVIKTNETGSKEWSYTYDGGLDDMAMTVQQTNDGGYIVAGEKEVPYSGTTGAIEGDALLVKLSDTGSEEWVVTSGVGFITEVANSVQQTSDGGYILAGDSYYGDDEMFVVKTNDSGFEEWNATYTGDYANSVQQTSDDGYIVAGEKYPHGMYLIKINDTGFEEWILPIGDKYGSGSANSVQHTSDGGYIVVGEIYNGDNRNICLAKIKENNAPVLFPIGDQSINETENLNFTITADDADAGDILTYTSDNLPTGATFNDSTCVFSWTPSSSQSGVYLVEFTVSDGALSDSETISITVNNVDTGDSSSDDSSSKRSSSGGTGNAVIVPVQEETEEMEENTTSSSDGIGNATIIVPEEETPEEEVVEETYEMEAETEATPGFSTMLTTGILLSAYVIYRRKD
ncbi:putative Ig domain-containing protein [Methanococcoides orientis]|uniref:Ig domain-containing protein n=1 Tax=Methanococcoides orientis TaxID=2822137 RepID=UPI001E34AB0F|nr:Ig domain-containing protein [Methanococcoides orientis]UGV40253.1 putative Ig domain-containing protein [Methanococcoides orientis]